MNLGTVSGSGMPAPDLNNVYLTGFMGSGKTTVARFLAEKMKWHFVDTDHRVEARSGSTIAEIFAGDGEPAFRELESRAVAAISREGQLVVALGGGALKNERNRENVFASGVVVYLKTGVDSILERVAGSDRPLLKGAEGPERRKRIEDLLKERAPQYESAHLTVSTDGKKPEIVAEQVLAELETWKKSK